MIIYGPYVIICGPHMIIYGPSMITYGPYMIIYVPYRIVYGRYMMICGSYMIIYGPYIYIYILESTGALARALDSPASRSTHRQSSTCAYGVNASAQAPSWSIDACNTVFDP